MFVGGIVSYFVFVWLRIAMFNTLSYHMSLRSEFRVVMPATIFAYKLCSVRIYLQLFIGGFMSYLSYLCLFVHSGIHHILTI